MCFFYNNSQVTRQEYAYDRKTVYYLKLLKIYSLSVIFCTFPATIVYLLQSTESCVSLKIIKHKVKHKIKINKFCYQYIIWVINLFIICIHTCSMYRHDSVVVTAHCINVVILDLTTLYFIKPSPCLLQNLILLYGNLLYTF